ncbi:MAG: SUMF1/EgtB/PvdO family nonheme iron enzyme [Bacteroidia bacterium]|nr:SUMF1/EgtB/PvdO family nonheme iron enzyme [Bacteroidia bacterium]
MKIVNSFLILVTVTVLVSCGLSNDRGELTGVPGRSVWFHPQPFGTIYVPTGSFHIGQDEQDILSSQLAPNKQISIVGFYMDDTEITNNEYRQFVYHVVDSIARETMGETFWIEQENGDHYINYDERLDMEDPNAIETLNDMFYAESERHYKVKQLDVRKLKYRYEWVDLVAAAKAPRKGYDANRADFIRKAGEKTNDDSGVEIYPDTLVWVRDFTYSFNEPMTRMYFWHPKYDNYPVVGVNWRQATAFCNWRTMHMNTYYGKIDEPIVEPFRLPTEYEWEYAARGGRDGNMYPWGSPYIRNSKGCFLANFKPGRGDYPSDGGFYPIHVGSYFPNDFGLYDMAGNVAEWTRTAYQNSTNFFSDDMNSDYEYEAQATKAENPNGDPETLKRKVIRGGSWKDIGHFINVATRTHEYQDSAKSFVGFRCVMTFMGRSIKDKN